MVGSQARILYSNEEGRTAIALAFNKAIADGRLKVLCSVTIIYHCQDFNVWGCLMITGASGNQQRPPWCQWHRQVSGDTVHLLGKVFLCVHYALCSPFRETSNIEDGSKFCAGEFTKLSTFTWNLGKGSSCKLTPDLHDITCVCAHRYGHTECYWWLIPRSNLGGYTQWRWSWLVG